MGESMPLLNVRLGPRASRNEIVGMRGDSLVVRVSAPPVDGKANLALCELLAKRLGIAKSTVRVVKGQTARDKLVSIEGFDRDSALMALGVDQPDRLW